VVVLGIDQSTRRSGYALCRALQPGSAVEWNTGVIKTPYNLAGWQAARFQIEGLLELAHSTAPALVAIEAVHMRRNTATTIKLAEMRGALRWALECAGFSVVDMTSVELTRLLHLPAVVKRTVKKARARWVATELVGRNPNTAPLLPEDEADAVLIATLARQIVDISNAVV